MGRLCLRYLPHHEEARAAVMAGFMKVFSHIHQFELRDKGGLDAWIRKIMVNECLMELRQKRKLVFMHVVPEDVPQPGTEAEALSAEEIMKLVADLPDGYRTVFNLFAVEGYSHKEIAEMLQITESTSRSQLTNARNRLKELLQKNGW